MDVERTFIEGSAAYDAEAFAEAIAKLLPLADDGHAGAQHLVAEMYRWGRGVEPNPEFSLRYYKAAADQGHPRAALMLFFLFTPGGRSEPSVMQSLVQDAAASEHYLHVAVVGFKELAETGDVAGMANLGFLFQHGYGVPLDGAAAIRWYTAAFDRGDHFSANQLALVLYEGDLTVRDKAKARFWYMKTKELNCQCVGIKEFEEPEQNDGAKKSPASK